MTEKIKKLRKIFLSLFVIIILIIVGYFFYKNFTKLSAIKIESDPSSIVYINGEQVGKTPIEIERKEREITVRLSPESFSEEFNPFETKVKLTKGVKTILRHDFSVGSMDSETQVVSFEKQDRQTASIAVVTNPEGASIKVNNTPFGSSPIRIDDLKENSQQTIYVDAVGFRQSSVVVLPVEKYLMTVFIDLAKTDEIENSIFDFYNQDLEAELVEEKNILKILSTPVGFLRVREEPTINSKEIDRVKEGDEYEFNFVDEDWYEIIFNASESGFISSEYATVSGKIVE